jgi:hypothetical protein
MKDIVETLELKQVAYALAIYAVALGSYWIFVG